METTRDVVIIIFGIWMTVASLAIFVLLLIVLRKVLAIISSVQRTVSGVEAVGRDIAKAINNSTGVFGTIGRMISELLGRAEKRQPAEEPAAHEERA